MDFVPRGNPVARLLCVPLTHFDRERGESRLYGVLNATRQPGSPPFTNDDLDYLTRFAGQLSIAVANSVAFTRQRERSDQLALVNAVLRETAGMLSHERILDAAVRRIQEAFQPALVAMLEPEVESGLFRVASAATRDGHAGGLAEDGERRRGPPASPWPSGGPSWSDRRSPRRCFTPWSPGAS